MIRVGTQPAGYELLRNLLLAFLMWAHGSACAQDVLRILTWPGYADPDLVKRFEQRHEVEVQISYIASDDDLWQRLHVNGGADFDLFAVNTAELQRYIKAGLSVPIDLQNIPNRAHQLPRFKGLASVPGIVHGGRAYAVPYTYSEMGLIYDRAKVDTPPTSMAAMWDPRYRGRVLAFDTSNHNFTVAGLLLGAGNPFQLTPLEMGKAVLELVRLRRNVLTLYKSPEQAVELYRENDVALIFGNYGAQQVLQLRQQGADVGYVIPEEGALAWLDCWVLSVGVVNKRLAELWINYTLEPQVSGQLTKRHGLANTLSAAPGLEQADKIIWLQPLEDFAKRTELWSRIRSGDLMHEF
ncbi:MAG: extracellular solute-binding protein [Gammaproteobacteria bacterium]|nr:extracellular solute-binding protein [Gammaproteobacteria bacterium]